MKTRKGDTKKSSDESWYYTIIVPRVFKKDDQLNLKLNYFKLLKYLTF